MASIEQRGKKSWRITVRRAVNGKNETFRLNIKGFTKEQRSDVEAEAEKFERKIDFATRHTTGGMLNTKIGEFAQMWIEDYVRPNLSPTTTEAYKNHLNKWILPVVGDIKLIELNPLNIVEFVLSLEKAVSKSTGRPLKSNSKRAIFDTLNSMLTTAVKWLIIPSNPCQNVQAPKKEDVDIEYYNPELAALLIKELEKIPKHEMAYRVACTISLFTTARRGEVAGLLVSSIDFENRLIDISHNTVYTTTDGIIETTPKSKKSTRTVSMGSYLNALLREYVTYLKECKLKVGPSWNDTGKLIVRFDGSPITPGSLTYWFRTFIENSDLPKLTYHGLRHTAISLIISQGYDIATAGDIAGHASKKLTERYTHSFDNRKREAQNSIEDLIVNR